MVNDIIKEEIRFGNTRLFFWWLLLEKIPANIGLSPKEVLPKMYLTKDLKRLIVSVSYDWLFIGLRREVFLKYLSFYGVLSRDEIFFKIELPEQFYEDTKNLVKGNYSKIETLNKKFQVNGVPYSICKRSVLLLDYFLNLEKDLEVEIIKSFSHKEVYPAFTDTDFFKHEKKQKTRD